jgi:hypothetical protein
MKQQRGQRQGVENLWVSRSGQRTKLYGKGSQYRARYVDTSGKEHTRRFKYKADAKDWLKQGQERMRKMGWFELGPTSYGLINNENHDEHTRHDMAHAG